MWDRGGNTITAITSVPYDRPLPNVVARLALTPIREREAKRVPNNTDVWRNVRSELLWTTVLGIIPSFLSHTERCFYIG